MTLDEFALKTREEYSVTCENSLKMKLRTRGVSFVYQQVHRWRWKNDNWPRYLNVGNRSSVGGNIKGVLPHVT